MSSFEFFPSTAGVGTGGGYESFLIHQVLVYRRSELVEGVAEVDRFGQALDVNPSVFGDRNPDLVLAGRLDRGKGGLVNQERSVDVYEVRHMIFLQKDAEVSESDAVRVLDPVAGRELLTYAKVMLKNLVYVNVEPHHVELTVKVQRGPW